MGRGLSLERRYAGRGQTFDTVRTNRGTRSLRFVFISRLDSNVFPRLEIWLNFNFFFVFLLSFLIFDQASFRGVRSRKENG